MVWFFAEFEPPPVSGQRGASDEVEVQPGQSVMQAAVAAMVPGIVADCGGACTCATCHGYVDEDSSPRVPPPSADELLSRDGRSWRRH